MKRQVLITIAAILLCSLDGSAQVAKLYTRKAKLADFGAKVTKVVLTSDTMVDAVLREEVSLRWSLSPFEFCSIKDYEALKDDSSHYFLHFTVKGDVIFLSLDKGGKEDDEDALKQGFEVVSIPVSGADTPTMDNLCYMSAFVDIIQEFTSEAMESDGKAYSGLAIYNINILGGKTAVTDPAEARQCFEEGDADTLAGVVAVAADPTKDSWCYKMLISCDTHRLCYFKRHKVSADKAPGWLKSELRLIHGHSAE